MGRSRGGLMASIHAVVDAEGRSIRLALTAGQAHDGPIATGLLGGFGTGAILLADRAYDRNADLNAYFAPVAAALAEKQDGILAEFAAAQGGAVDLGEYYNTDPVKTAGAMRPSATLYAITD